MNRPGAVVVWDDQCSFCSRCARFISALDWAARVESVGSSDHSALERLGITPAEADYELKVVTATGTYGGYDGLVEVSRLLPLTRLLAPLLGMEFIRRVGRRAYRAVAARRRCGLRSALAMFVVAGALHGEIPYLKPFAFSELPPAVRSDLERRAG